MAGSLQNRRIFIEDVLDSNGEIDVESLLFALNIFMEGAFNLLDGNLDFGPQVNGQITQLNFQTPTDYVANDSFTEIVTPINIKGKRVQCVIPGRIVKLNEISKVFTDPVTISWVELQNKIKITHVTGLEDDTKYSINILVV